MDKTRVFGLDLIRSISIWMVLLYHQGYNIPNLKIMGLGGFGVEIFFVLSGFLIGQILIKQLEKENTFKSIINFWIRRWFRILPLYYFILFIRYILDPNIGLNLLYYVFFLQNNFYGISFFEVSWSLVIEEWFYLIAPFVLFAINHFTPKSDKTKLMLIMIFLLLVNVGRYFYFQKVGQYGAISAQFVFRMDSLFLGVALAFIKLKYQSIYVFLKRKSIFLFSGISLMKKLRAKCSFVQLGFFCCLYSLRY